MFPHFRCERNILAAFLSLFLFELKFFIYRGLSGQVQVLQAS